MSPTSAGLRLYVLRHGEPERRDLFYGHYDIALSARGLEQARAQAECIGDIPFVSIHASDSQRATIGAGLVAQRRGLDVEIDPRLREMSLGALECMPHAEAMVRYPQWAGRSYLDMLDARMPDGGESVRDLDLRVFEAVETIARPRVGPKVEGRWPTVLIYAHNTVARVMLARAAGAGVAGYRHFSQRYGAINRIDVPALQEPGAGTNEACLDWSRAEIGYANRDPMAPRDRGR
ncbi:MAG: histidine phosphatase family protein [Deltaproteobacteria bacterium]|nr:histidine phosphatase family protein [Deltaproteobacteria bacterium]